MAEWWASPGSSLHHLYSRLGSASATGRPGGDGMTALVIQADARHLPLADASVDLIVTSPPYFALRSYRDDGVHYDGQVGSEASPGEFLDALIECTREMVRVLKPSGSIFVNLGDKMAGTGGANDNTGLLGRPQYRAPDVDRFSASRNNTKQTSGFVPAKSRMLLPHRYAIRCVDELGLICRMDMVWNKPNGLPESVTDRVRASHEYWFHLTKEPRYFSAVDEIREPHAPWTLRAYEYEQKNEYKRKHNTNRVDGGNAKDYAVANPLGKIPASVWTIPTGPLTYPGTYWVRSPDDGRHRWWHPQPLWVQAERWVADGHTEIMVSDIDHFAAFPQEWPRRLILGWSPPGGVVADPFGGTGTVAGVARTLGRTGISVDLSADYSRLARWRIFESGHFAKSEQRTWADRQETLL